MSRNSFIFIHSCRPIQCLQLSTFIYLEFSKLISTFISILIILDLIQPFKSEHQIYIRLSAIYLNDFLSKSHVAIIFYMSESHFHPPIFPAKCQLWESSLILFLPGISQLQKSRRTIWTCHIKLTPTFLIPNSIRADSPIILHHVIKHWTAIFIK